MNQVLTEAYKGGLLNITLDADDGLSIGTFASIPDFPIDLTGVTEFNINLTGASAPGVSVVSQADSDDGVIFVSLLDLNLKVNADFDDGNGLQEILDTTIDLRSPFDIGVTPDNTLTIGIEAVPEVNVHNFRFQLGGIVINSGSNGVITNLIATLAPELLPRFSVPSAVFRFLPLKDSHCNWRISGTPMPVTTPSWHWVVTWYRLQPRRLPRHLTSMPISRSRLSLSLKPAPWLKSAAPLSLSAATTPATNRWSTVTV